MKQIFFSKLNTLSSLLILIFSEPSEFIPLPPLLDFSLIPNDALPEAFDKPIS